VSVGLDESVDNPLPSQPHTIAAVFKLKLVFINLQGLTKYKCPEATYYIGEQKIDFEDRSIGDSARVVKGTHSKCVGESR